MIASRRVLAFVVLLAAGTPTMAQETTRVSVDSSGAEGNNGSGYYGVSLSSDGQIVAFESHASNLVAGDTNGTYDVFVRDRSTGVTTRVSLDSSGAEGGNGSFDPSISADGQVVAFDSFASNLVSGDTNGQKDVFVHDRSTGLTECVSVDSSGVNGNSYSEWPAISSDGRFVAFTSYASNLVSGDTNGSQDIFVHDRSTGTTERISVDSSGVEGNGQCLFPSISADGQIVAFTSYASDLVPGDSNGTCDIFVHDRSTGLTERDSVDSTGAEGNDDSKFVSISADGQTAAFWSAASNLVANDTNGTGDIFVRDRSTGFTERVSLDSSGAEGNGNSSFGLSISADGQIVAFYSAASNLVAGDTNGTDDVFVHYRSTGITARDSVDSSGVEGNNLSQIPSISADGMSVAFYSHASNLVAGDTNGIYDAFVHDSTRATWSNYGIGFAGKNGIPSFTAETNPALGSSVTLDLANSSSSFTAALVFVGFQQAQLHSALGGDLLLVPAFTFLVALPPSGTTLSGALPTDEAYCGFEIDLQALEADSGAAKGVSFTQGLELVLGH